MIIIEQEKCTRCRLCVDICHENCITLDDNGLHIDATFCSNCTQCIAICSSQALHCDGNPVQKFNPGLLPRPEQLDELFKERRSIRRFKKEKIQRTLLEEITEYGAYAPTHNFNLRIIIVDDEKTIIRLDQIMLAHIRWIYSLFYKNPVVARLASWLGYSDEFLKAKPKIESALKIGCSFHNLPAAFIFVVGDKRTPLSDASAQYALAQMMFYAQVKGVGCCLWGNAQIFIDKNHPARRILGLERHERIYGAIYMGIPAVRFFNKIEGRKFPIRFI